MNECVSVVCTVNSTVAHWLIGIPANLSISPSAVNVTVESGNKLACGEICACDCNCISGVCNYQVNCGKFADVEYRYTGHHCASGVSTSLNVDDENWRLLQQERVLQVQLLQFMHLENDCQKVLNDSFAMVHLISEIILGIFTMERFFIAFGHIAIIDSILTIESSMLIIHYHLNISAPC